MNNKMLAGFLLVLIALLALPVAVQQLNPSAEKTPAGSSEPEDSGAPAAANPAAPQAQLQQRQQPQQHQQRQQRQQHRAQAPGARPQQRRQPRRPTAKDFQNTTWEVHTPHGRVEVSLLPGGKARATHSMVGTIEGNWRLQGNQIKVHASVMGQNIDLSCQIKGNTLVHNGAPIRRLR